MSWRDTVFVWRGSLMSAVTSGAEGALWEGRWVGVDTPDASAALPTDAAFEQSTNHFRVNMETIAGMGTGTTAAVVAAAHAAAAAVDYSPTGAGYSATARAVVTGQPYPQPSTSTFSVATGKGWMLDGEWYVDTAHTVKVHHPSGQVLATGRNDYGPFISCGTVDLAGGELPYVLVETILVAILDVSVHLRVRSGMCGCLIRAGFGTLYGTSSSCDHNASRCPQPTLTQDLPQTRRSAHPGAAVSRP